MHAVLFATILHEIKQQPPQKRERLPGAAFHPNHTCI